MALHRHPFTSAELLADGLADAVAANLKSGIEVRGVAVLAVSGGQTPKRFFAHLSKYDLDWKKVVVTLVDERWVDSNSERSNAKLVQETLLQNKADHARFVSLWSGGLEPNNAAIALTNKALRDLPSPFDAVILGMGNDGHTASFFPGADTLHEALISKGPALAIHALGAGEPRVTLTLPMILKTHALYLHIEGAEKLATLETAIEDGPIHDMPVRAVLRQTKVPVNIYSC
jgi:6-phosphogluconolactonase